MASRFFYQFQGALQRKVVSLYLNIPIGGTGAVGTIDYQKNKGMLSVVRNSTGLYTITLGNNSTNHIDQYKRVLSIAGVELLAAGAAAITAVNLAVDNVVAGTLQIATQSATATNADPDTGSVLVIRVDLSNT